QVQPRRQTERLRQRDRPVARGALREGASGGGARPVTNSAPPRIEARRNAAIRSETPRLAPQRSPLKEATMTRSRFKRHECTELIAGRLKTLPKGGEVTYDELRRLTGLDPTLEGYPYVKSARDILLRAERMVFRAVNAQAIRRLDDAEIAEK